MYIPPLEGFSKFWINLMKKMLLLQEVFLKNDPVLALKNKNLFIVSHVRVPFFSVNMGRDLCWRQCYHEIWQLSHQEYNCRVSSLLSKNQLPYTRYYKTWLVYFCPIFFTVVYIVERLVLQIIYELNKEILQFLDLKSRVCNQEQFQIKSGL